MSNGDRQHRSIGKEPVDVAGLDEYEPPGLVGAEHQERGQPLTDPMRFIRHERAQAASQIQRSLKAWRKTNGPAAAANVPPAGSALPKDVRARMESAVGADLSGVTVSTGGESASAAEAMNAKAFTVGQDVHFGAGQYAPGTKEGDRLLAHELAHTVQASKSGVKRKAEESEPEAAADHEVSQPHEPAEQEADAVADHAADKLHGGDAAAGKDEKAPAGKEQAPKIGAKLWDWRVLRKPGDKKDPKGAAPGKTGGAANKGGKKDDDEPPVKMQLHHYLTNKHSSYTPAFEKIAKKYGLELDQPWNLEMLPHNGRHPTAYHEFVLTATQAADDAAKGKVKKKFLDGIEANVKAPVRKNPEMLRKAFWEKP